MIEDLSAPEMLPYQRHIIFCVGEKCADSRTSEKMYEYLKARLRTLGLDQGAGRICRSKSTCLGVCQKGPVAVVYPEGRWYYGLDEKRIDALLDFLQGKTERLTFEFYCKEEAGD